MKNYSDFREDKNIISSSGEIKDNLSHESSQVPLPSVRPWVRLFARHIDYYSFSLLVGACIGIYEEIFSKEVFSNPFLNSDVVVGILLLFVWIFVESFLLSSWGTTFGKWLLRVKLRDKEARKLDFPTALRRSFLVWFRGIGMGLPIVSLFTLIFANRTLKRTGCTTWDKDCSLVVTHQEIGIVRTIVAILFFVLLGISLLFLSILENSIQR